MSFPPNQSNCLEVSMTRSLRAAQGVIALCLVLSGGNADFAQIAALVTKLSN